MKEIGHVYDFDDQFFRMVTVSLANTLSKRVRWINKYTPENDNETGYKRVFLPFYTSLTGDERFVFDAFIDDIVDKRVSMNTDQYQRGHITLNSISSNSEEFSNPNQYLAQKETINGVIKKIISKVKAVPITLTYDVTIQLATANEIDKVTQKLMNTFFNYQFFNFDYYGIKIDAQFILPDDKGFEFIRDVDMQSDRKRKMTFTLEIKTNFPIFMIDSDDLIVCDNDGDFDWDKIGVPRPTLDFKDSLKRYNEGFGQTAYVGGDVKDENNKTIEGKTEIRKVYWYNLYREMDKYKYKDNNPDWKPEHWDKEDFDGIEPGKSKKK